MSVTTPLLSFAAAPAYTHTNAYDLSGFGEQNWSDADRTFLATHLKDHPDNPDYCIIEYSVKILNRKEPLKRNFCIRKDTLKVYLDKPYDHLAGIFGALILGRPFQAICKMTYHCIIPLSGVIAVIKTWQKVTKANEQLSVEERTNRVWACTIAVLNSVLDIVRTPLCCLVLTVIAATGAILYFTPDAPKHVMKLREISAELERDLMHGDKNLCLAQCMQPLDTLKTIQNRSKDFSKSNLTVLYGNAQPGSLEYGFYQLAVSQCLYANKVHNGDINICGQCIQKLGCC